MGPLHPRPGAGLSYKGANSRDVAIYAITKIETEKDVPKWLYFWGGNSMFNYQVDIDGIIIKSRHQSYNKFDFTKGRHLVEVLVMPNGSTIPFCFDLKDKVQDFSRRELQASFKEKGIEDFDLWMASFYSPDKCSESVEIELEDSIRPVVLLLSNEEAAFVNIKNSKGSKLKAVLLRNFLTDVQFDANGDIPVYGMLQPHSFMYVKSLFEDDPNVSYGSIVRQFLFKNVAQTFPGKYISGFSYHRKPSTFRVPETHIRKKDYIRAKKELEGL